MPTLFHASRQNLTKSLCNVNKRVKLISCFKLEYRYRLSVSADIGPKISVIGISVNFHIGASLIVFVTSGAMGVKTLAKLLARKYGDLYVISVITYRTVAWLRTCLSFKILGSVHLSVRAHECILRNKAKEKCWRTFGWTWMQQELFFWTFLYS